MSVKNCRVCGNEFFQGYLLRLENIPGAAQFFPDAKAIATEKGAELEVYQCSGCGLVQLNIDPVPYYREVIRAAAFSQEMEAFRREQFNTFVKKYSLKHKKVIEIGCGRGEYLALMQQADVDAYGLEYSNESVIYCEKMGLHVSNGFIQSSTDKLNFAPFDGFFILNFLEHLPDPNSTLRGIYNNLTEDAIGLVEVPNFDMIIRNNLFSEFIADHLFYFTRETLSSTLGRNGYEIIECENIWHEYIISAVVRKKKKIDLSNFQKQQTHLKNEIHAYIGRFKDKRVAIWGAGHQALAIISLMGLSDKVKYVIDSAPFKQGKFTPASHIPIVAPEALNSDPVDAVIVMVASYSDEVIKTIRQKNNKNINVSVVRDFGLELVTPLPKVETHK